MAAFLDNTSTLAKGSGGTSDSWSHTILKSLSKNGLIIVVISAENTTGGQTGQQVNGVTFNGIAMTQIQNGNRTDGHSTSCAMFELHGSNVPAPGTYNITVTYNGSNQSHTGGAMSFGNIKNKTVEASTIVTQNGGTSISTSLTTLTKNALLVVGYSSQNTPNATSTTGDTRAFNVVPASGEQSESDGFYRTITTPASSTVTLTTSNPETEILILASFETIVPGGIIGSDI